MEKTINWDYEAYEYYEGRLLQVILIGLYGKEKAKMINDEIIKEIKDHQGKESFSNLLMEKIDKMGN